MYVRMVGSSAPCVCLYTQNLDYMKDLTRYSSINEKYIFIVLYILSLHGINTSSFDKFHILDGCQGY